MANIANVKVKAGNVLELSGSSVSISGSGGLALHTANGGIVANAGTGDIILSGSDILLSASNVQITGSTSLKGDLVVSGTITANVLKILETSVETTIITQSGSTKFGNDSGDTHQFSGSILASGSMTIAAGSGQYNGSGAGLTNIPNGALVNSAITINGTSTSLGGTITTVGAGNGLAEAAPDAGKIVLSVSASGTDSGLVISSTGVAVSSSVARMDRDANWGTNAVSASWFVGNLSGSQVSASAGVSGSTGQFGTLVLGSPLSLNYGGTAADLSAVSEGGSGFVIARSGSELAAFEITSSDSTVTVAGNGVTKKIDLSVNVGAANGVTLNTAQTITGKKTFTGGLIVSGSGTALTIATEGASLWFDHPELLVSGSATLSGPVEFQHSVATGIKTITGDDTVAANDYTILVSGAGQKKITLGAATNGRHLMVKKIDDNTDRLYLSGSGCLIDGLDQEFDLYGPFQAVNLVFSGSSWYVL